MAIISFSDDRLASFFYDGIIPIRAGWRLIFRWNDGNAYDVSVVDYH